MFSAAQTILFDDTFGADRLTFSAQAILAILTHIAIGVGDTEPRHWRIVTIAARKRQKHADTEACKKADQHKAPSSQRLYPVLRRPPSRTRIRKGNKTSHMPKSQTATAPQLQPLTGTPGSVGTRSGSGTSTCGSESSSRRQSPRSSHQWSRVGQSAATRQRPSG